MKLSLNTLSKFFTKPPTLSDWVKADGILDKLTMAGIELESIEELSNPIAEFKITPNRGDCLSINGILREIRALTDYDIVLPLNKDFNFNSDTSDKIEVIIAEPESCPNYIALTVKNLKNKVLSDKVRDFELEITANLTAGGFRTISPIVDITNYVMLELGQPLHAFDMSVVGNKLQVRYAKDSEALELLDDTSAKLKENTLLICDANNIPSAIAGVMGGKDSAVTDKSADIIIESAFFIPEIIMGKSKQYAVSSDSAYRFERGVDYTLQLKAVQYAAFLIKKYCGGEIGVPVSVCQAVSNADININYSDITRLIGQVITEVEIEKIIHKLGFNILEKTPTGLILEVPSFRFDIKIKEDIVEEIARVYGYDNIAPILPTAKYNMPILDGVVSKSLLLKRRLVDLGYNEIVGYAFIEDKFEDLYGDRHQTAIRLKNPIAGLNLMRTSLIADLTKVLQSNLNRGHESIRIFEFARVFHGEDSQAQPLKIAGLIAGSYLLPNPLTVDRDVDFYDLSHDIKNLLSGFGVLKFVACNDNPVFHSGRCAKIYLGKKEIGIIGQLHPSYISELSLLPYVFELDLSGIMLSDTNLNAKNISKFQKVRRDLAFIMPVDLCVGDILEALKNINIDYLIDSYVFDIYVGDKLSIGVKSVAFAFVFQSQVATLTDIDISGCIAKIQQFIVNKFNVQLRT